MTRRILILIALLASAASAQQGFAIVVNKDNPNAHLTRALLRRMLMGETATWPGGEKVVIFLGPAGNAARAAALKEICGMTESDYSKHALQASFDGGKPVPKSLPSDAAVRQLVQGVRNGLGIVEPGGSEASLKVLIVE
ncbi:MAG: hypothetical protein ABSG03_28975 [Bryobacteraceae bacterium]|jgi:hypothetical protein